MDIAEEVSKALSDPDIMNKVSSVLASLGGEEKTQNAPEMNLGDNANAVLGALSKNINDDRTNLLLALKPFLSEKRAPYMDSALTIMKLVKMGKIGKDLKLF
ncbi:MAG: hypothetical protein IKA17_06990 [Clostridia bacterium]|jgi:hypothetical protein|nr:hypothetical protein [Clostridia bacterium]